MKNIGIVLVVFFTGTMLLACVTEDGVKNHVAQIEKDIGMKHDKRGVDKAHWQGIVYPRPGSRVEGKEIGMFPTRDACAEQAKKHIKQHKMRKAIFACQRA